MTLFVLLLIPKVRKFELIQFQRIPEGATVKGVLQQVKQRSSNPEFAEMEFVGLYCPKTEQELLLVPRITSSRSSSSTLNRRSNRIIKEENDAAAAASTTTTSSLESTPSDPLQRTLQVVIEEEDDLTVHATNRAPPSNDNLPSQEDPASATTTMATTTTKSSSSPCPPSTPQTQSTAPETPQSTSSADFPSPGSQAPSSIVMMTPTVNTKNTVQPPSDSPPTSITIDHHETSTSDADIDLSPMLNLSEVGQLLVAIPERHALRDVRKQCHKIISSPAFAILTNGANFLDQSGNSQLRQELQLIQEQKLAQTLSETLTQQHEQNNEINKAYQDQAKDLEARKAATAATMTTLISPTSGHGGTTTTTTPTSRPDEHGLSPLDLMRVQQNQQRAAEREIKRSILNPYHVVTTEDTTTDNNNNNSNPAPTDDSYQPGTFISPSQQKRMSIEAKKKAELDAVRQQGLANTLSQSPFFAASPKTSSSTSPVTMANRTQPLPTATRNRATRTTITVLSAPPLTADARPAVTRVLSLQQVPVPDNSHKRRSLSNSLSELEELKSLGLAQSIKSKLVQTEQQNLVKTQEYKEQQQDLEIRKSQSKPFQPTRGSASLSAADVTLLRQSKEKQESRQKERETLGYFPAPPTDELRPDDSTNKDWKTTGQVLTTLGTDESLSTTKEWQAPNHGAASSSRPTSNSGRAVRNRTTATTTNAMVPPSADQRCACILM